MSDHLKHQDEATAAPGASWHTVLVIDDEPIVRHSLEILLETYGYQVALARNGEQGLAAFRRIRPDLVLTDIVMPIQDGIETILTMRRERPDGREYRLCQHRDAARRRHRNSEAARRRKADCSRAGPHGCGLRAARGAGGLASTSCSNAERRRYVDRIQCRRAAPRA
jgi:CheY-like chemotaxis protein